MSDGSGSRPVACFICRELVAVGAADCPRCGCPVSVSNSRQTPRSRAEACASRVPSVVSTAATLQELYDSFLELVIEATDARGGAVWDLDNPTPHVWHRDSQETSAPLKAATHLRLLQSCSPDPSWLPVSAADNDTGYMLVLRPFETGVIRRGIIELFQRADAPEAAGDGYAVYLDRLAVYFERSPLLNTI